MERDERELLLTAAWMFARHGQDLRALTLRHVDTAFAYENEVSVGQGIRDGIAAAVLAALLLRERRAAEALKALNGARFPSELHRAEALLETRALAMLGRRAESVRRWNRYVESTKGKGRSWVKA